MITITAKEVKELKSRGNCVCAYPRKGVIVVDGFKYYKAGKAAILEAKAGS